jgi:ATP dependent DNA ligase domain
VCATCAWLATARRESGRGARPRGALWVHEIKHDGFRIVVRKDGDRVRLYSRPGNDLTDRFPPKRWRGCTRALLRRRRRGGVLRRRRQAELRPHPLPAAAALGRPPLDVRPWGGRVLSLDSSSTLEAAVL